MIHSPASIGCERAIVPARREGTVTKAAKDPAPAGTLFKFVVPPQLTITSVGANILLTWPTNAVGFTLQFSTNLVASVVWTPVSQSPVVFNGQNLIIGALSGARQFYRLSQ